MAATSLTNARSARRVLRICRQWILSARAICWPMSRPSLARSISCSERSVGDPAAAHPVGPFPRRARGRKCVGASGCARFIVGLEGGVVVFASRLQQVRQSLAQGVARARHRDQTQSRRDLRVSLWRRLLEQAAQPLVLLRERTGTAVPGLPRRRLHADRLWREFRLLVGADLERALRFA